jgi:hypothetical protein
LLLADSKPIDGVVRVTNPDRNLLAIRKDGGIKKNTMAEAR